MTLDEFINDFREDRVRVCIEPDNADFAALCELIEEAGMRSWDKGTVLDQARRFHVEFPYLAISDGTEEVSCWRNADDKRIVRACEIDHFSEKYDKAAAEASELLMRC